MFMLFFNKMMESIHCSVFSFFLNPELFLRAFKKENLQECYNILNNPKEKPERQLNVSAKQFKLSSFSLYRQQLHFEGKCFTIVITHNKRNVFFPFILLPW